MTRAFLLVILSCSAITSIDGFRKKVSSTALQSRRDVKASDSVVEDSEFGSEAPCTHYGFNGAGYSLPNQPVRGSRLQCRKMCQYDSQCQAFSFPRNANQ